MVYSGKVLPKVTAAAAAAAEDDHQLSQEAGN
jgi:hypothetical protein